MRKKNQDWSSHFKKQKTCNRWYNLLLYNVQATDGITFFCTMSNFSSLKTLTLLAPAGLFSISTCQSIQELTCQKFVLFIYWVWTEMTTFYQSVLHTSWTIHIQNLKQSVMYMTLPPLSLFPQACRLKLCPCFISLLTIFTLQLQLTLLINYDLKQQQQNPHCRPVSTFS